MLLRLDHQLDKQDFCIDREDEQFQGVAWLQGKPLRGRLERHLTRKAIL